MEPNQIQIPHLSIRAAIMPDTINLDERTVEVCFATDNPVRVRSWDGSIIYEILSFDAGHVRLDRLNSGAPLLDNHNKWGSVGTTMLGVVEKAWVKERKGYALLRFSKREDVDPIFKDVADGITRNVSVGYNVFTYEQNTSDNTETFRATDWEPAEISLTPIPADIATGVRSAEVGNFQTVNIIRMEPDVQPTGAEGQRNAPTPPPTPPTPVGGAAETQRAAVEAATTAERLRITQIRAAVATAQLPESFANGLIDGGQGIDQAREAIIAEWARQAPGTPNNQGGAPQMRGKDDVDHRREGMESALLLRANPSADVKVDDKVKPYRYLSLLDMARTALEAGGHTTAGMSPRKIALEALQGRSFHSTSDFPIILGNTINRTLRSAYELAPRTFMPFCVRGMAKDFREMSRVQLSNLSSGLDEIKEGGEYTYATVGEGKEVYKVVKYGKKIAITWETLVNDDLGAFNRIPTMIANQAAQKQSDLVWGIITGNPNMGDGVALFHANHGNLAASGTAIAEASLDLARQAIRTQKDPNGKDYLNLTPRFMLVGPAQETAAQRILQGVIMATKAADTNVFKGFTDLIVEPRLTGNAWYLSAAPGLIDTIEYSFLDGEGELFTEQYEDKDVDGLTIKARMVFGAKALDYRAFYKNPGQ